MRVLNAVIFILFCALAAPVLADEAADKAAFKVAYARYNDAIKSLDAEQAAIAAGEALKLGKKIYNADSPSLTTLSLNLGYALLDAGQYKNAIKPLIEGVEKSEKQYGAGDPRILEPLWALAEAYVNTKKFIRANPVVRKISFQVKNS